MRETALQSNAVSHWLGAKLESALPASDQDYSTGLPVYYHKDSVARDPAANSIGAAVMLQETSQSAPLNN